jgi:hypothetical protein
MTDDTSHPIESKLTGYVALTQAAALPSGLGVGMYSRDGPDSIRKHRPGGIVTNVKRARHVAREYHDWDLPSEDEIRDRRMRGC